MLLDIVFSLDSVITAVGMVDELWVMVAAVIIAVGIMMLSAEPISAFVHRHPTVKMLALSFLLLIGVSLIAEGFDHHIPKGYIYFAMGFSVFVEAINLRLRRKIEAGATARAYVAEPDASEASAPRERQSAVGRWRLKRRAVAGASYVVSPAGRPSRLRADWRFREALSMTRFVTSLRRLGCGQRRPCGIRRRSRRQAPTPAASSGRTVARRSGHSAANFSVRHLMVSTVRGQLGPVTGTVEYDGKDVRTIKADVTIDVKSINTQNANRDNDLRSAGLLRHRQPPEHHVQVEARRAGHRRRVQADWRPDDSRHHEGSDARRRGPGASHQGHEGMVTGTTATTRIKRSEYGLKYNAMVEAGPVVGDEVTITIDLEIGRPSTPAPDDAAQLEFAA